MAAEYRDPRPLAVAAILWTWIWLGAQALYGAVSAFSLAVLLMAENVRVTMQLATSDWKLATIAVL
jgi:hypothetical protein